MSRVESSIIELSPSMFIYSPTCFTSIITANMSIDFGLWSACLPCKPFALSGPLMLDCLNLISDSNFFFSLFSYQFILCTD
jgi:hypothetical protein